MLYWRPSRDDEGRLTSLWGEEGERWSGRGWEEGKKKGCDGLDVQSDAPFEDARPLGSVLLIASITLNDRRLLDGCDVAIFEGANCLRCWMSAIRIKTAGLADGFRLLVLQQRPTVNERFFLITKKRTKQKKASHSLIKTCVCVLPLLFWVLGNAACHHYTITCMHSVICKRC